jgi:hypothetical protein
MKNYKAMLNLKTMGQYLISAVIIVAMMISIQSCKDDTIAPGDASIISFKIGDVTATIDETAKTITAELGAGTALTAINPVILISSEATISPASGVAMDFTNPVVYKVTDKSGTIANSYTATIKAAEMRKIAFLGQAAENTDAAWDKVKGTDFDLKDDQTAAKWFFTSMANSTTELTYISFEDVANGADLTKYHAVYIQYDGGWWGGEVAQFPKNSKHCLILENGIGFDVPNTALADKFITKIKTYYEAGGNLLLGNYAGSIVDEIGAVSKPEYAPNNSWGGPDVDAGATASAWMVRWAGEQTSPLFAGIQLGTDDNIPAPAFIMIEAGGEKKNRSNQYNLNFGPWAPNGDADPLSNRRTSFLSMTGAKILIENGGKNEPQMVQWDAAGTKGAVIAIVGGTYDWYIGETMTNKDRNMKTLTKNCLIYLSDLKMKK